MGDNIQKIHESELIGRCYICGKTPAEFTQLLQIPSMLPVFKQQLTQDLTETQTLYSNFVNRLQFLLTETENYKPEITYAQYVENRELYKKMMPHCEELLTFVPNEEDQASFGKILKPRNLCTIKDMRMNIQRQLSMLSQGTITKFIRTHNPLLSQKLDFYYSEARTAATVNFDSIHFPQFTYEYLCDVNGEIVVPSNQQDKPGYYFVRAFDQDGKLIPESQPISTVVQFRFKYELCPICATHGHL